MDEYEDNLEPDTVYIALGSNLGDRNDWLDRALEALELLPGVTVAATSLRYETRPIGLGTRNYLNMAARLYVIGWEPVLFLHQIHRIEANLGRTRDIWWGDRTIDIDILMWDDIVTAGSGIKLPHPRMHERDFVLRPLLDVVPEDLVHPTTGKTIRELHDALDPENSTILL